VILWCRSCGYAWRYGGRSERWATCPRCKASVSVKDGWLEALPVDSDQYAEAVLLAVTEEGDPVYFDVFHGVGVSYVEERGEWVELRDQPCEPLGLLAYHYHIGVSWMADLEVVLELYGLKRAYSPESKLSRIAGLVEGFMAKRAEKGFLYDYSACYKLIGEIQDILRE